MNTAETISQADLDALNFESVVTLQLVDAVDNDADLPLSCEPPHRISDDLGCKEYVAPDKGVSNDANWNLDLSNS